MKILITGGSGLIGTALTERLLESNHAVTIVSRSPNAYRQSYPSLSWISWDLNALVNSLDEADAVINLAGTSISGSNPFLMRWTKARKREILESRLQTGSLLSEAISRAANVPEVLIQASAIGYYGNTGDGQIDETAPPGNDYLAEVCRKWEQSTISVEELGVRRIVVRIGLVFSRSGGLLDLLKIPFQLFAGGMIGTGNQYLSWVHVNDLVNSMLFLLDNKQNQGVYNITAPEPVKNTQFASVIGSVLNRPVWFTIPEFMLKLVLGEAATLALDGRSVFPKRLLNTGYSFQFDQIEPTLLDLLN